MLNPTKNNLKKVEALLGELGYKVRYEKGNFQSGYAVLEAIRVAVVSKFYDTEARFNCLTEILDQYEWTGEEELSEAGEKTRRAIEKAATKN